MGGCCTSQVHNQVQAAPQADSASSREPVKPDKKVTALGEVAHAGETNGFKHSAVVETAEPPGSVDTSQFLDKSSPRSATGPPIWTTQVKNGHAHPVEATSEEDIENLLSLVPVEASEEDAPQFFQEYAVGISERFRKTFDCTWEFLEAELARSAPGVDNAALQWFWVVPPENICKANAKTAAGLLVVREVRTATTSIAQVCHFSLTGDEAEWRYRLPVLLDAMRLHFFRSMPISSIRAKLWYAHTEEGKYKIDPDVESLFKEASWRWFSLTNTKDGKRGQVMQRKRHLDAGDPQAPEAIIDLCVGSCLLLPYAADWPSAAEGSMPASESLAPDKDARAASNSVVLAACLRRLALAQKEGRGPGRGDDEDGLGAKQRSPGLHLLCYPRQDPASEGECCDDMQEPDRAMLELVHRLGRRGSSVAMVRSADASSYEDCESWVQDCLACCRKSAAASSTSKDCSETAWLAPISSCLDSSGASRRVLCGGLVVATNWRDQKVDPSDPMWVRVPVKALGSASASSSRGNVAYLATEDADLFAMVWSLPEDTPNMEHNELYRYCQRVLMEAPPRDTTEGDDCGEDANGSAEVVLPRFRLNAPAAVCVPASIVQAGFFGKPRELLAARLSTRLPPSASLRPRPISPRRKPSVVLKMEGTFVFCLWHCSLEDLEVPLFAMIVRPSDWSTAE